MRSFSLEMGMLEADHLRYRRLASKSTRKDFLTKIIEGRAETGISAVQIAAHSSDFVFVFCSSARGGSC